MNFCNQLTAPLSCIPIEQELPWVGSYFEIPKPEDAVVIPSSTDIIMHVLLKDLSVKEFKISVPRSVYGADYETAELLLRQLAYKDPAAIAHMTYRSFISRENGARIIEPESPAMRTGPVSWEWLGADANYDNKFSTAEFVKR